MTAIVSVEFLQAEFDRALAEFASSLLPEAMDTAVRKLALDICADTMIGLNGVDGLPKRIDTGRLRAAWRVGLRAAGIKGAVPTSPSKASEPGDGTGEVTANGTHVEATVSNNVKYARFVEDGTVRMRGGHHLKRALILARRNIPTDRSPGSVSDEIHRAFGGG